MKFFDASVLKDKFDVILLWQNTEFGMPKELIGIQEIRYSSCCGCL